VYRTHKLLIISCLWVFSFKGFIMKMNSAVPNQALAL